MRDDYYRHVFENPGFNEIPQLRTQLETKGEWHKYYGSRLRFAIAAVREMHCGHDCNNCKYARRGKQT